MKFFQKMGFVLALVFTSQSLFASTYMEVFKRHSNPVFIETGSCTGDGIQLALQAGFSEIHSIEIVPELYAYCCQRYKDNPNVHLYLGDSAVVLYDILEKLNQPATFWLDGHYCGGAMIADSPIPIIDELSLISAHPIKNHTILIDDVRLFDKPEFLYIKLNDIIGLLKSINPDYRISYEDGYIANDVLVAEIPKTKDARNYKKGR